MVVSVFLECSKFKKVNVGNDQEMAQSERNSHSIESRGGQKPKSKMAFRYLYQVISFKHDQKEFKKENRSI